MASEGDPATSSIPKKNSSTPFSSTRGRISVHRALGGGAVADLLLWRRRHVSALVLVGTSVVWFLFERAGYGFLSLLSNALLLLVAILFFWAKSASLLNRPLPPLPNLEVSDKVLEKVVDHARIWINCWLAIAHDIAIGHSRTLFLKVTLILWAVSYVGSLFNFLTLVYMGILLSLSIPALYNTYQDSIDEILHKASR